MGGGGGDTTSKTNSSNMPVLAGRVSLCVTLPKRGIVPLTSRKGQLVCVYLYVYACVGGYVFKPRWGL